MKINIHSDNVVVTEAIKTHINDKISKLDKYFEDSDNLNARIVVKVRGRSQIIEVTIPTKHFTLRSEETHSDLYAAIDLVIDKLERQIRKNKTKMQHKLVQKKFSDFNFDYDSQEDETDERVIIKRKRVEMKPMNEEEAILQMDMLDHDFFIYKEANTGVICVLYKRKDGHYGVIETE